MAETTDELLARMAQKYGLPSAPPPQQPAPQPPAPQPQPERRGIIDTLRGRTQQIDQAVDKATRGYKQGGKICGMAHGDKIQGPGTPTSDSIPAQVEESGEPIRVSTGERILSKAQDGYLSAMAKKMGFDSLDAMLEHGTGQPVGPTVKGGERAAATGMGPDAIPDEVIRAARTPFNYDEFARQQIARSMAADATAASGTGGAAPAASATQTATTASRGAGLLGGLAQRLGSFNPGGAGAVMLGSAAARGIDDAINAARTAGQEPYRPSALVNQIPMEGTSTAKPAAPVPSADTSNYGNEGRGITAAGQQPNPGATVSASPQQPNIGLTDALPPGIAMGVLNGRASYSGTGTCGGGTGRDVMDIYKNASDIQAQQSEQPTQAGIIRNTQTDDRRAFDNFVNRTTLQSAINSAITQNTPRSLASIANLENAQTALAGQIPRQELQRDTLEQQGDLRRRALDQEARYKGALVGVQQDEAKAKGLLANYAGLEQQDKAATNALKRQSTQMDIVQKQLMQGYLNTFNDPKATDAQKAEAIRAIYAMQGKSPSGDNQEAQYKLLGEVANAYGKAVGNAVPGQTPQLRRNRLPFLRTGPRLCGEEDF